MPTGIRYDFPHRGVMIEVKDEKIKAEEDPGFRLTVDQESTKFEIIRPVIDFKLVKDQHYSYSVEVSLYVYVKETEEDIHRIKIAYWDNQDWVNFEDEEGTEVERWLVQPSPLQINDHKYVSYFKVTKQMSGDPPIALGL